MKKILLPLLLLAVFSLNVRAQQLHFMSQYLQHNSFLNPGAAGISNANMVGVSYRSQWASFPGNPRTYMVYGDANLEKLKAGIGGYVYRDETGPTSRTGVQLAYSKHIISRDEKHKLGLGIELRGLQYAIDKGKILSALGNDPALGGASSKFGFDAGAGVYYTNGKLSAGAAVSQLIQSKLQLADVPNSKLNGRLYRHYNLQANYKIQTGDDIYLIPNALVRFIQNSPTEFEAGVKLDYQDKLWVAVIYKVNQLYSLQTGVKIADKLSLSYSYDAYNTPISIYDGGSGAHEIGLRFDLKK
ncbi:type IX secretion system membrane protein PorP/SprF [Ferruginibacter yonginensis]|uniref:Type IX secretion system membrane protein PorP/SprF n=1 Tax=Ferruginibacter yonginensis TaxID=1310416 RepID=A0ABV8QUF0_9BACT